jgi:hypothetical protein
MKKIRPIDFPEDVIRELAKRLQVDDDRAADLIAHLANVVADAVVDFDVERYFNGTRRDIALGRFDCYAPAKLPPLVMSARGKP